MDLNYRPSFFFWVGAGTLKIPESIGGRGRRVKTVNNSPTWHHVLFPLLGRRSWEWLWCQKWAHEKLWQELLKRRQAELEILVKTKGQSDQNTEWNPANTARNTTLWTDGKFKVKLYLTADISYKDNVYQIWECLAQCLAENQCSQHANGLLVKSRYEQHPEG